MLPWPVSAIFERSWSSSREGLSRNWSSTERTWVLGPTRLSASCPASGDAEASAATNANQCSVRTARSEQETGRETPAAYAASEPAFQGVLQLETRAEIGAGRLLGLAAELERELHVEEQTGTHVASRRQREASTRLLPDLEHIQAETLAGCVGDGAGEGTEGDLLAHVSTAAATLKELVVGWRPAGHDVRQDVILAEARVGGELEPEAVEPSPGVHVDD